VEWSGSVVGPLALRESVRGRTALHSTSDWRCTRALAAGGADLEAVADGDGHTPLQTAAVEGKAEVVAQLLEAGAKVNARATTVGGCRTC
jgi:ankyrin repeat protein